MELGEYVRDETSQMDGHEARARKRLETAGPVRRQVHMGEQEA